jgi:hypothetical protein
MSNTRKFTIECEVPERWVNDFCSFLEHLEHCGSVGHSALIGFYADGDGDFRPKFRINTEYEKTSGQSSHWTPELMFDAG